MYIALPDTPLPVFAYELGQCPCYPCALFQSAIGDRCPATDVVFAPHGKEIIQRYADPTQKDGRCAADIPGCPLHHGFVTLRWLFGEVLTDYLFRCSSDVFAAEVRLS